MKPISKFCFITAHILVLALLLGGCGKGTATHTASLQSYSLTSAEVEGAPKPTAKYDVSLLANQGLFVADFCWVDPNNILCLVSNPAEAEMGGENNLPQTISFYMLNIGDDSFDLLYQGEHNLGKLQRLANNQVAIVSPYSIAYFNYNTHTMVNEIILEGVEDSYDNLAASPNGRYFAYSDGNGNIILSDSGDEVIAQLEPKTIGYNWLSNPIWSKDSKYVAFFCGYEPYQYDNIAIVAVESPEDITPLNYDNTTDVFPVWPTVGDNLLVLKNFFNNPDNLPREIQIINPKNTGLSQKLNVDYYKGFTTLVYANTIANDYYFISDKDLYFQSASQKPELVTPPNVAAAPDTTAFTAKGERCAILQNRPDGSIHLYVVELNEK